MVVEELLSNPKCHVTSKMSDTIFSELIRCSLPQLIRFPCHIVWLSKSCV